jgi:hypothetical protein
MELTVVPIVKPDAAGQSHFIKTVEDLHEALVGAVPGIRFGLAFCEASGKRLVRWSAPENALAARERKLTGVNGTKLEGLRSRPLSNGCISSDIVSTEPRKNLVPHHVLSKIVRLINDPCPN